MPIQTTTLVRAFATLTATADANITDGETVILGGVTYTFEAGTLDGINDVPHVTGFAANMVALVAAVNLTGTVGTDFYTGSVQHPYVFALLTASGVIKFYSRVAGAIGNLIAITVGTSAITLTDDNSGLLKLGAGSIDDEIDALQASAQCNSEVLSFLHAMEVDPTL